MIILDFSNTSKQAFKHGFMKGLSAPVMLFGQFTVPPLREIKPITPPSINDEQALANDWKAIGMDFNKVIVNHVKETDTPKTAK